ncbi:tetratricopeptide repeat protein [Roseovarius faecimaris]|uniref:Tetratricopeptide repeat protein n=1 Tax=Roseovarius faecimaris TaxID=2494550 RepID=A0A6I6IQT7_9RHOB|nr:tetratricopeptide repeat protein [Roseovarius faecimaris]QGX99449.1 tetratricopeptide repeat protein [Roseovarius faecimaris]
MIKVFLLRGLIALFLLSALSGLSFADPALSYRTFLSDEGIAVTSGDVPGYVPDAICAECHADKAESFAEMGMARSFYRPHPDKVIENFSPDAFFHEATNRLYGMAYRDGEYIFTRHSRAPDGSLIDGFSVKVDWIMGSGNHSRVYLYQTEDGALFQLPLAWYSQEGKWAMAPGFEFDRHLGVARDVPQRCMACHNAFADYPEGSGRAQMPRLYPKDMPEGIGCQRCHGPGGEHVARALSGEGEIDALRAAIVHPGKLPRERLYSICYGCHMQPTVAVNSQVRLGRGHYSFRPGEDLRDFLAMIDIVDATRAQDERFDINHHPYRMEQSACFTQSQGQLGCLTCHDPHVKIKPEERAAHYRQACLSCHTLDPAGQPEMQGTAEHPQVAAQDDCTSCHMPERRTQDVVDVWMTDHKITRYAAPGLRDPIPKEPAVVQEIFMTEPGSLPEREALVLQLIAILEYTARQAGYATDRLAQELDAAPTAHFEPYLALLQSYLKQQRLDEALALAPLALAKAPDHPKMKEVVALSYALAGDTGFGIAMLRTVLDEYPEHVDLRYNLARLLVEQGELQTAREQLEQVLALRSTHAKAWRLMAMIADKEGDPERAISAYLKALSVDPDQSQSRGAVAELLSSAGRPDEAERHRMMLEP